MAERTESQPEEHCPSDSETVSTPQRWHVAARRFFVAALCAALAMIFFIMILSELTDRWGPTTREILTLIALSAVSAWCSYGLARRRPWARWMGLSLGFATLELLELRWIDSWSSLWNDERLIIVGAALVMALSLSGRAMRRAFEGRESRFAVISGSGLRPLALRAAIVLNASCLLVWLVAGRGDFLSGWSLFGTSIALVLAITSALVLAVRQKALGFGLLVITAPAAIGFMTILAQMPYLHDYWGSLHTACLFAAISSLVAGGALVSPALKALRSGATATSHTSSRTDAALSIVAGTLVFLAVGAVIAVVVPITLAWQLTPTQFKSDEGSLFYLSESQRDTYYKARSGFYDMSPAEIRERIARLEVDPGVKALIEEDAVWSLSSPPRGNSGRVLLEELLARSRVREIPRRTHLAELLHELGDDDWAELEARRAVALAGEATTLSASGAHRLLAELAEEDGRYGLAFEHLARAGYPTSCGCDLGYHIGRRADRLVRLYWSQ